MITLAYHRVADLQYDPHQLAVTPDHFEEQMELLEEKEYDVKVTFDDGYEDNYTNALPILEKHGVNATFFITTSKIDSPTEFWWDDLDRILRANNTYDADKYMELHRQLKPLPYDEREKRLAQLCNLAGCSRRGRSDYLAMTRRQVLDLAESDIVEIGSHTTTHCRLTYNPRVYDELCRSKTFLETLTGRPVNGISYPYGEPHDVGWLAPLIAKKYYKYAYSAIPSPGNGFMLPRHIVRDWPGEYFKEQIEKWLVEA